VRLQGRPRLGELRPRLPDHPAARALAVASLIDWIGTGVWLAVSTVFFVRVVGLGPGAIGVGLGIASVAGMLAVMPVANLTRRWPAGPVAVGMQIARGLAFLSYLAVDSAVTFAVAATLVAIFDRPTITVNQILVARVVPKVERSAAMATMHVAANLGVMAGAALGTLALVRADRAAFNVVVVVDAASFLVAAWVVGRAVWGHRDTGDEPLPEAAATRLGGLPEIARDWRFVAAAVGTGLLALHIPLLNVVTPLWLADATEVPLVTMGAIFVVNTVMIVLLQVPLARPVQSVRDGARAATTAAACLIACCAALAVASFTPVAAAIGLLVLAVVMLTLGEITQNAASWAVSFGLSPPDRRQSSYLGFFGTAQTASVLLGPALLTLLIEFQGAGAFVTIACLLLVGAACVRLGVRHDRVAATAEVPRTATEAGG
jgi:MFS family permease